MRILYVAHTNDWHGSSIALYNIIKGLYKSNEVHVLLPVATGELTDKLKELGVTFHHIPFCMNVVHKNFSYKIQCRQFLKSSIINWRAKNRLRKLLVDIRPDIVHCNVGPVSISSDVCKELMIPHVWHIREYQDKDFGMSFIPSREAFLKKVSDSNNTAIAITKDIFDYWNLDSSKDKVIYDGVFSENVDLPHEKKQNYLLFVGRVDKSKGTLDAIKAFKQFSNRYPDYKLLIVGSFNPMNNSYARECKNYVEREELSERVLFFGERRDIYRLMSGSKALIVPSYSEGFGFITVEGMLNKTPVIGRNTGGTREQFDNGVLWSGKEIGLRFNTVDELFEEMCSIPEKAYGNMTENAFKVVWEHYSLERNIEEVKKIYREILNKNGKS